jgi:hypothetical protein
MPLQRQEHVAGGCLTFDAVVGEQPGPGEDQVDFLVSGVQVLSNDRAGIQFHPGNLVEAAARDWLRRCEGMGAVPSAGAGLETVAPFPFALGTLEYHLLLPIRLSESRLRKKTGFK